MVDNKKVKDWAERLEKEHWRATLYVFRDTMKVIEEMKEENMESLKKNEKECDSKCCSDTNCRCGDCEDCRYPEP